MPCRSSHGSSFRGRVFAQRWLLPLALLALRLRTRAQDNFVRASRLSSLLVDGSKSLKLPGKTSRLGTAGFDPSPTGCSELQKRLSFQAVGSGSASWILDMGGTRILVNPNLEGSEIAPETVHKLFDAVLLTCEDDEFFHMPTLAKMELGKTNFLAAAKASERLTELMARRVDTIQPGPGGACDVKKKNKSSASVAVVTCPGAGGENPFGDLEQAFTFVNLDSCVAVGYDARGLYLGRGAASARRGIPDEAYEIDYLVSPDLRESAAVVEGLAKKQKTLKAVVRLPSKQREFAEETSPLGFLDKAIDTLLGGIDDTEEAFREFVKKQSKPTSKLRLETLERGGDAVVLER